MEDVLRIYGGSMEDPWRMTCQTSGLFVLTSDVFAQAYQYQPHPASLNRRYKASPWHQKPP